MLEVIPDPWHFADVAEKNGQTLVHKYEGNQTWIELNEAEMSAYKGLCIGEYFNINEDILKRLYNRGLIIPKPKMQPPEPIPMLDCQIPILNSPYARWRKESINTILLFNTTTMVHNNPLLLTNFLGAFIWQKIVNGYTVGQIRQEIYNRFGLIGVLPFLQRLYFMGFIKFLDSSLLDLELPEKAFLTDFPETSKAQNVFIQTRVPWYLLLEVNTSCQLRCTTCYQNDFSDSGLSTRQLLRLIDDIVESEVLYVTILGGEPTLRKDLITVIKRLRENGVFVKLITNGLLFDEQQACSLAETFLNQVEVSFDGISPATHDRSRGVGNFDKAIKAIGVLQRAGISKVAIIVTIDNVNIHEMSSLPRFLDDLNVKEVYLSRFKAVGRGATHHHASSLNVTELSYLNELVDHWHNMGLTIEVTDLNTCSCGRSSAVIDQKGNLRPCSFGQISYGNIFEKSLKEVWSNMRSVVHKIDNWKSVPGCYLKFKELSH